MVQGRARHKTSKHLETSSKHPETKSKPSWADRGIGILRTTGGKVAAWGAVLGTAITLVSVYPRVSIAASDPVDPVDPFSVSFTVTNNNYLPLENVKTYIGIAQAGLFVGPPGYCARFFSPQWRSGDLHIDDKYTVAFSDVFRFERGPEPIDGFKGDVAVIVQYSPWFLPVIREKVTRFVAHRQTNGQYYWYAEPLKTLPYTAAACSAS